MPKTIVNIITEDNPIPAYLFIKEKYEEGDRLMYISAKDDKDDLDALAAHFKIPASQIDEIVLKNDMDEITYEKICRTLRDHVSTEYRYCVNLAGGTRYMALAVQQVFELYDAEFFYVQVDQNLIVHSIFDDSIYDDDDYFYPIRHRLTIAEYLEAHGIQHNLNKGTHKPIRSEQEVTHIFNLFANNKLSPDDHHTLELIRANYRNRKKVSIGELERFGDTNKPEVPHLSALLKKLKFEPSNEDKDILVRDELEYLTGGWFEEYVYYLVQRYVEPQDLAIGVVISRVGAPRPNELDVVFTKGNKLMVIECKTGVETEHMFSEIVYKVCAIKEALLGISCQSFIFSLKKDEKNTLKRIAKNMDITFVDNALITSQNKLKLCMEQMKTLTNDLPQTK